MKQYDLLLVQLLRLYSKLCRHSENRMLFDIRPEPSWIQGELFVKPTKCIG